MEQVTKGLCILMLICLCPPPGRAETVYRCPGNVYQQTPCQGGTRLDIDPATNMIGTAPSVSDQVRAYAAEPSGPWVATIPMPPRMEVTPSTHSTYLPRGPTIWVGKHRHRHY